MRTCCSPSTAVLLASGSVKLGRTEGKQYVSKCKDKRVNFRRYGETGREREGGGGVCVRVSKRERERGGGSVCESE